MTKKIVLLPKGTYPAKILSLGEPASTPSQNGHFCIRVYIEVNGQESIAYISGTLNTMIMIFRARKAWEGLVVDVLVGVHEVKEKCLINTFDILWPTITLNSSVVRQEIPSAQRPATSIPAMLFGQEQSEHKQSWFWDNFKADGQDIIVVTLSILAIGISIMALLMGVYHG